jgi:hypothetical protein
MRPFHRIAESAGADGGCGNGVHIAAVFPDGESEVVRVFSLELDAEIAFAFVDFIAQTGCFGMGNDGGFINCSVGQETYHERNQPAKAFGGRRFYGYAHERAVFLCRKET